MINEQTVYFRDVVPVADSIFPIPFDFMSDDRWIAVYVENLQGSIVNLLPNLEFIVANNTVSFTQEARDLYAGLNFTCYANPKISQEADFQRGMIDIETVERALDQLTLIAQASERMFLDLNARVIGNVKSEMQYLLDEATQQANNAEASAMKAQQLIDDTFPVEWGTIEGNIQNQIDLNAILTDIYSRLSLMSSRWHNFAYGSWSENYDPATELANLGIVPTATDDYYNFYKQIYFVFDGTNWIDRTAEEITLPIQIGSTSQIVEALVGYPANPSFVGTSGSAIYDTGSMGNEWFFYPSVTSSANRELSNLSALGEARFTEVKQNQVSLLSTQIFLTSTIQPGYLDVTVNNGVLNGVGIYANAYAQIIINQNAVSMVEWLNEFTANNGICGKFAIDTATQTFRIPCIPATYFASASAGENVGDFLIDQMRSIQGGYGNMGWDAGAWYSGCFEEAPNDIQRYAHVNTILTAKAAQVRTGRLGANFNGAKTRPQSVVVSYQMKMYGALTNIDDVDIAQVVQQQNVQAMRIPIGLHAQNGSLSVQLTNGQAMPFDGAIYIRGDVGANSYARVFKNGVEVYLLSANSSFSFSDLRCEPFVKQGDIITWQVSGTGIMNWVRAVPYIYLGEE